MGLIGAPLLLASTMATGFGLNDQLSGWSLIAALPVAAWELSVAGWMIVKGVQAVAHHPNRHLRRSANRSSGVASID